MSVVADIITTDQLHELWGCGFTVVERWVHPSDPFHADPRIIPANRSYQWLPIKSDELVTFKPEGWRPVAYSDHEGFFAPYGTPGDIEVQGMVLCWKPKKDVEVERAKERSKALDQEMGWARRFSDFGITVGARTVLFGDETKVHEVNISEGGEVSSSDSVADVYADRQEKTLETTVAIPKDKQQHIPAIFAERDRIEREWVRPDRSLAPGKITDEFYAAVDKDPAAPWWPTLRAIILPYAIEAVRAKLKESTDAAGPAD